MPSVVIDEPTIVGQIGVSVDGHRSVLSPGRYDNGVWVPTDISGFPEAVRNRCTEAWTSEVVAAYQLAFPWSPPAPPTPEELRIRAVRLNARRQALLSAIKNSDDAQLIAAVATRYPNLNGDAIKAVTDIVLVLAAVIRD
jgi:hypothetical protein